MKKSLRFLFMLLISVISIELVAQSTTNSGVSMMQMSKSDMQEEEPGDNFQSLPAKIHIVQPKMASTMTMVVTGDTAVNTTFYGVTLEASADPEGLPTAVRFEFGTDTTYGYTLVPIPDTIMGTGPVSFQAEITGIAAGTTYHFRVRTENGLGVFLRRRSYLFNTGSARKQLFVHYLQDDQSGPDLE